MSAKSKLKGIHITLLKLFAAYQDIDDALASYRPLYPSLQYDSTYFVERGRRRAKIERRRLQQRIDYLKREHYIEIKKEKGERLVRLTSKAKYEILRLRFAEHMQIARGKRWDKKWRLLIFDVPEDQKKYRDFFRKLLKQNGFRMWQFSVWIAPYDPEPHLHHLLQYLGIADFYELIEVDCTKCTPRLKKKFCNLE